MNTAALEEELDRLARLSAAELRTQWQRVTRTPPPQISPPLLELGIAYELQVRRHGGLSRAARRQIEQFRRQLARTGAVKVASEPSLKAGTRLSRDWHGRTYHVLVVEDGFLFEDRHYRSLSHIAAAITGTHWSGPRFFGLKSRRRGEASANGG